MAADPFMLLVDLFSRRLEGLSPEIEGLTWAQFSALRYLESHDNPSIGAIAQSLGISNPAATKAVDRLVARGWLDRRENPQDRRTLLLELTEAGNAVLSGFASARLAHLNRILEGMRPEEKRALKRGMRAFLSSSFIEDRCAIEPTCLHCGSGHNPDCIVNQAHLALLDKPLEKV